MQLGIIIGHLCNNCTNVILDMPHQSYPDSYIKMWTAQDSSMYYYDSSLKDIDVGFIGEYRYSPNRSEYITYLKNNGVNVLAQGGRCGDNESLSHEAYAGLHRRCKISINFSDNQHLKGRIFESAQCGSMILTDGPQFVEHYFEPNVECVIYNGKEDLANKCKYYMEHEDERNAIALRAHNRSISEYSASKWWNRLLSFAS